MNKARQSIRQLMDIAPPTAIVKRGGEQLELATEDIVSWRYIDCQTRTKNCHGW